MSQNNTEKLRIYKITHRTTGARLYQVASNAEDALSLANRIPADCFIVELKPRRMPVPDHETIVLYKIPCDVCPYQYAVCDKPEDVECPTRYDIPDLKEWLKRASEAHLCPHVGIELYKIDYNLHQKWVPLEQAIRELSA